MDTEYILGCALELAETTALENAILSSTQGAYHEVRLLVDTNRDMPDHFLQNTAAAYLDRSSDEARYYFALHSLPAIPFALKALKECAEHVVQQKAQVDLGITQPPRLIEGLRRPGDSLTAAGRLVEQDSDITEGLVRQMLEVSCGDLAKRWSRDLNILADAADWYRADEGETFNGMLLSPTLASVHPTRMLTVRELAAQAQQARARRTAAQSSRQASAAKRAITKATKLFHSLGQQKNLSMLISGKEVILSHPDSDFKFVLRPPEVTGWLIDRSMHGRSHTPYDIQLLTKDDIYLARLCVYFDSTPVLDQLLAMSLFVQSGEELRILEKANWFGLTDWNDAKAKRVTDAYPQLAAKLPGMRKKQELEGGRSPLEYLGAAHRAEQAHWEPFRGRVEQWIATWMEPARLAFERAAPLLQGLTTQLEAVREIEHERQHQAQQRIKATVRLAAA
jgi:hypothetical protein